MSEEYNYIPPHYKLDKKINPEPPLMVEFEEIVDVAFGDDYQKDIAMVNEYRLHADKCGCGQCQLQYQTILVQTAMQYVKNSAEE